METGGAVWRTLTGAPGEIRVVNGALRAVEGEFEIVEAPLPGGPYGEGSTLYAGFTVTVTTLPSGTGSDFAAFSAANGPRTVGRIYTTTQGAAEGTFRIGIASALHFPTGTHPVNLNLDTPYRVVVRLDIAGGFGARLWVDPESEDTGVVFPSDGGAPGVIEAFAFRQRLISGNGMGAVTVDDVVVATTFAEAKGGSAPPVVWEYTTSSAGTITITGFTGAAAELTVPDMIDGMPVTRVTSGAFRGKTGLKKITLPEGLIAIGSQAFSMSGITSIVIPNGITAIEPETFTRCVDLVHVTLPENLQSIGQMAFAWTGLREVTLPATVTTLHSSAFMMASQLEAIHIHADNAGFVSVEGVVFTRDLETLLTYPAGRPGEYRIPASVRRIESTSFSGSVHLGALEIPDTVTFLGSGAFQECTGLVSVRIGRGITTIPQGAFAGCSRLVDIRLPDTLEAIDSIAFARCRALQQITIPASVRRLGGLLFEPDFMSGDWPPPTITHIYFQGDAPEFLGRLPNPLEDDMDPDEDDYGPTVYYRAGTTGWEARFGGRPTMLWDPRVTLGAGFGIVEGKMGFPLTGAAGLVLVVEATSDLTDPVWNVVGTVTLTDGQAVFRDPEAAVAPVRLYRFRSP